MDEASSVVERIIADIENNIHEFYGKEREPFVFPKFGFGVFAGFPDATGFSFNIRSRLNISISFTYPPFGPSALMQIDLWAFRKPFYKNNAFFYLGVGLGGQTPSTKLTYSPYISVPVGIEFFPKKEGVLASAFMELTAGVGVLFVHQDFESVMPFGRFVIGIRFNKRK